MRDLLIGFGIMKNQIAVLFMDNSADFMALFLALVEIGAKPVPVNPAYRKIELDEIMSNADPHVIIAETHHLPLAEPYCAGRMVIQRRAGGLKLVHGGDSPGKRKTSEFDASVASINYTYRGYGYPLGARISHDQYLLGAEALVKGLKPAAGENMLVVLPFSYIFPLIGCLCVPLLNRMTAVISGTVNPMHLFGIIKKYQINIITAVPEIYQLMYSLKDESTSLPSLAAFVSGGSDISAELFGRLREAFNVEYLHGYGLTEFTPVSRNIRGEGRPGTMGPACQGVECRIEISEQNGAGEIMVRSAAMAKEYHNRPVETAEAHDAGWFRTGDIGRMEDGHLVFVREKKGTRKFKGSMVDLEEVRRAIRSYPGIADARVECNDNVISAGIACGSGTDLDGEALKIKKYLENSIAKYKIPRVFARFNDE